MVKNADFESLHHSISEI